LPAGKREKSSPKGQEIVYTPAGIFYFMI
jgi:hypothetical protein